MPMPPSPAADEPSLAHGRLCIVLAALMWSLSGAFAKLLTHETTLGLNTPPLEPLAIAFYRALFAGLVLLPTLRGCDLSFQRMMLVMVASFATMNALFVSALTLGTAANAIFLQYTGPMWMYLASVWWLGEPADRRSSVALAVGLIGIAVIVGGGWHEAEAAPPSDGAGPGQMQIIAIALGSGVAYAGVIVCLRVLRDSSSRWLTVLNHLGSALVLVPFVWRLAIPTVPQLAVLFLFGTVQMALPYWLVARGLRVVSPQEAGTITLLEPILNPLWAFLVVSEMPSPFTFVGGAFIVGALAWRYAPRI